MVNRKEVRKVKYKGEVMSLVKLSKLTGIKYQTLENRYNKYKNAEDVDVEKLVANKPQPIIKVDIDGKLYLLRELAAEFHISEVTLRKRYRNGFRGQDLLKPSGRQSKFDDLIF